jgi:alpha-L-rhamnosidase
MRTISKIFLLITLLCSTAQSVTAQEWKSDWITAANIQDKPNTWICFRKQQNITAVPKTAIAKIAADTKYWLYINEKLVVFEGGLKRGPNANDTYFDEIDIAPFLQKGENTIAVLTWYMGKSGFSNNSSGKAGLIFQCVTPLFEILSDNSWKAKEHPAFETSDGIQPNYRLPESSIRFDARKDIGLWQNIKYDDTSWTSAVVLGKAPVAPWNNLVKRPIPQWKNSGLVNYINSSSFPAQSTGDTITANLPTNIQVTPYFKIDAPEGLKISIQTDDFKGGGEPNVHAQYITKSGVQEFECPGWMNGQKVKYHIPKGIKIIALNYRETGYDTEFSGAFKCDDVFFNQLWDKARRTLYVTMRDNYMDCPDRERAQWWGDEAIEGGEAFYALSPSSHLLWRKGMYELTGWQREDNVLFSPIPNGMTKNIELPSQMLASVGYYGFWTYYLHSGDKQAIVDNYESVKKYISLYQLKEDGTLLYRKGDWDWGDWGNEIDSQLIQNAWYQLALIGMQNMAHTLGKTDDEALYSKKISDFKTAFNKHFWTGTAYRHYDYKGLTDDRGQALAVISGVADGDKFPALFKIFQTIESASPYMEKYVMEALFLMHQETYALSRTKKRYGDMVNDTNYSTLFEGWGIGNKGYGGGTTNHAWSGGPLTVLMQYMCGIAPLEPGYTKFQVMPQPGSIKTASATVDSVKGEIMAIFESKPDTFELSVTAPKTTTMVAGIPNENVREIKLNGKTVYKNGKFIAHKKIIATAITEKYISFELPEGTWSLKASKTK